jgi:hypothetical protein
MESGNRGIVLENELTCSVSWPPSFMPWPEAQMTRQSWRCLHDVTGFVMESGSVIPLDMVLMC